MDIVVLKASLLILLLTFQRSGNTLSNRNIFASPQLTQSNNKNGAPVSLGHAFRSCASSIAPEILAAWKYKYFGA